MDEILAAIFQGLCEAFLQLVLEIFAELGKAVCIAGSRQVRRRKQEKERQEYRATQPTWTLLRSAESPQEAVKQSEELLRPASGANATKERELLRADETSIDSRNLQEHAMSITVDNREC